MAIKNVSLLLAFTVVIANAAAARDLPIGPGPGYNLAARLEASDGLVFCWNALMEIKSCSNGILIFFLNGRTDIGPDCCHAVDTITHNCWPEMLTSLGFTPEEGNILDGYCNASGSSISPVAASSSSLSTGSPSPSQYQLQANTMVLA